jgi:oligopeptide transport system substrate-binding protein
MSGENRWMPFVAAVLVICLIGLCVAAVTVGQSWLAKVTPVGPSTKVPSTEAPAIEAPATQAPATEPPAKVTPAQAASATPPSRATEFTPSAPLPSPSGEQVLRIPGGDPPTLDPHLTGDSTSAEYIVEIFSGLVTFDRDLKLVPDIAERWEVDEKDTAYTFYLRKDATFHDGKPVRAQDFKWSFERACDPRTRSFTADSYLGDIVGCRDKLGGGANEVKGVEVVDDHTLRVTIDQPRVYFLSKLTFPAAFVLDQENVERGGKTWTDQPNGTGPFNLAEVKPGVGIVLERNDNYYRDPKPLLERVEFVLTAGSAMVMYEQGDLDLTAVGLNDVDRVLDPTNALNQELRLVDTLGVYYIDMNTAQPPFDDIKVRQAFNYALDRERIVNVVYKKTRNVAWGIVPPSMPGYSNPDLKPLEYDPEKARQLIAESKYGDVSEFPDITFHVLGAGGATGRIIEAIAASYKENLGVQLEVQQTDWATFLGDLNNPNSTNQMWGGEAGWIADYPDPHNFLDVLFRCGSNQNHDHYCNPQVDKLLDRAAADEDSKEREQIYRQVEQQVVDDAPWVPLFFDVQYWLVKPHVKDAYLPPMVTPKFQYYYVER